MKTKGKFFVLAIFVFFFSVAFVQATPITDNIWAVMTQVYQEDKWQHHLRVFYIENMYTVAIDSAGTPKKKEILPKKNRAHKKQTPPQKQSEKDLDLAPIEDLLKEIKTKKHLREIPSSSVQKWQMRVFTKGLGSTVNLEQKNDLIHMIQNLFRFNTEVFNARMPSIGKVEGKLALFFSRITQSECDYFCWIHFFLEEAKEKGVRWVICAVFFLLGRLYGGIQKKGILFGFLGLLLLVDLEFIGQTLINWVKDKGMDVISRLAGSSIKSLFYFIIR